MTRALRNLLEGFFLEVGRFFTLLARTLAWTFRRPFDAAEWLRQMVNVGVDSTPVILLTSMFTGMVMALQTFSHPQAVPRRGLRRHAGGAVDGARAGAVLGALVLAGRSGSAMGAELGTMRVTEQIDALEVLATDPVHYLVVPRVWATTIMLPLLVAFGDAVGIVGGYLVSVVLLGANPVSYIDNTFRFMSAADLTSGLIKAAVFGMLIALIGCQQGFYARGGAEGVGRATTRAVVLASIAVLISDFFLTKMLF